MSRLTKAADKILRQGMNSMKFQSVEHRILANSKLLKVEPGEFLYFYNSKIILRSYNTIFVKVMLKQFIKSTLKMKLIQWV